MGDIFAKVTCLVFIFSVGLVNVIGYMLAGVPEHAIEQSFVLNGFFG